MGDENQNYLALSFTVVAGIAAVAYADHLVITISLAYLYILPLALSALIYRLRISLPLCVFCVLLHDAYGPFAEAGWLQFARNLLTLIGFVAVVLFVNRLGAQRARLAEIVRAQRDALENEIRMAARVQQRLLPQSVPCLPGFELAGRMYPARVVGGDYFDFIEMPDERIGLAIADVSGKGLAAALLMPSIETTLRLAAETTRSTAAIVDKLNHLLFEVTEDDRYATLFYAVLDPASKTLQYTNAGHLPPLLLRAEPTESIWLDHGETVAGLMPEVKYSDHDVTMQPGDLVVLYTDGVVEAENRAGEQFSQCRFETTVRRNRHLSSDAMIQAIYKAVSAFTATDKLDDDLTVVVLRALPEVH